MNPNKKIEYPMEWFCQFRFDIEEHNIETVWEYLVDHSEQWKRMLKAVESGWSIPFKFKSHFDYWMAVFHTASPSAFERSVNENQKFNERWNQDDYLNKQR